MKRLRELDADECLSRAKVLIEESRPEALRYAALELRFAIEAITYAKLQSYSARLPQSVIAKWQPPQAMIALLEVEPMADQSYTIRMGVEESFGEGSSQMQTWGRHEALDCKWLSKHYNKLGNLLHAPALNSKRPLQDGEVTKYLRDILVRLQKVVDAPILGGSLASVATFPCEVCGETIIRNWEGAIASQKAECLNPNCRAEYAALVNGEKLEFRLEATEFQCLKCGTRNTIENRHLIIGTEFRCSSCKVLHRLLNREWQYGAFD